MKILKSNIFHHYPFKLDFLKENQEYIDFDWIVWNEYLDWSIEEFEFVRDKVNFPLKTILRNPKITSNEKILLKYFDELKPEFFEYSSGITIKWDENALNTFSEKIDIVRLSPMLEVSTDYLEKEKNKIDWESLSYNEYIHWTEEFIERNKELLNWRSLSHNSSLPWSEELIDKFTDYWDWNILNQNRKINWTEQLINKYEKKLNWDVLSYNSNANLSLEFVEKNIDKIDFRGLSRNNKIEWSKELISKYEDKLNFGNYGLSWNFNLPWDKEIIDKYKDKWSWSGISANRGINWNLEILDLFYDDLVWGKNDNIEEGSANEGHRRNGFCLSNNSSLPWSLELLKKYENRWNSLASNYAIWEKVLEPILTEEMMKKIIKEE